MENFVSIFVNDPLLQLKIGIEDPHVKITLRTLYEKNKHRLKGIAGNIAVNYQVYKNGAVTSIDCHVRLGDRFTFRKKDNSGS